MNQAFPEISRVYNFFSPNKIILGEGTVKRVGDEAKASGRSGALIVTDPGNVSAGYRKIGEDVLHTAKIEAGIFRRVVPEPPARRAEEAIARRETEKETALAAAGGRV